jgi:hypothetical protein
MEWKSSEKIKVYTNPEEDSGFYVFATVDTSKKYAVICGSPTENSEDTRYYLIDYKTGQILGTFWYEFQAIDAAEELDEKERKSDVIYKIERALADIIKESGIKSFEYTITIDDITLRHH